MELVKYLMPKFGDSKFDLDCAAHSCLHKAVCGGDPQVVRYLIEEGGFDPSLRDSVRNNNCNCACLVTPVWLNMPPCAG